MDPQLASKPKVERRLSFNYSFNFPPSVWGEYFLKYENMETHDTEADARIRELKEEVRRELLQSPASQRLDLIDYIHRLGVSHHFEYEIHQLLLQIHNQHSSSSYDTDDDDLQTVALRFRLLRQQGFEVSCEMFDKFIGADGNLKGSYVDDVAGLLSLYEAANLRTHEDEFLDRAVIFTAAHLKSATAEVSPSLLNQVAHALDQPFWKGIPRLEAKHYLTNYHELNTAPHFSQTLLTLAKMDFDHIQRIHQKELGQITRWWKKMDFVNKLPFARDRIVECYLWSLGIFFEPKYHLPRETVCKILGLLSMIDDTFDTHGKLDEIELFDEAIQRWELSAMDLLPKYMRILYEAILNTFEEIENEIAKVGNSYRIVYLIEKMKCQVRDYLTEAKWFHLKNKPKTYDEYMRVSLMTSGMYMLETSFIVPLTVEVPTKDSLESLFRSDSNHKIVNAANVLGRLVNDIQSRKREQNKGDVVTAVECYMNEHGVTEEEAVIELYKQVDDAWKDATEEYIKPSATVPKEISGMCLNFLRVTDVIYKQGDGYTHGGLLKEYITALLVEVAPME